MIVPPLQGIAGQRQRQQPHAIGKAAQAGTILLNRAGIELGRQRLAGGDAGLEQPCTGLDLRRHLRKFRGQAVEGKAGHFAGEQGITHQPRQPLQLVSRLHALGGCSDQDAVAVEQDAVVLLMIIVRV